MRSILNVLCYLQDNTTSTIPSIEMLRSIEGCQKECKKDQNAAYSNQDMPNKGSTLQIGELTNIITDNCT